MLLMNIVLWILQVALAIINALHGWLFITWSSASDDRLREHKQKSLGLPPVFRSFIGVAELLAAIGLILPAATGILPWLTPLAATGFALVMASASVFHLSRGETSRVISSAFIFIFAVFVAYMRWRVVSF